MAVETCILVGLGNPGDKYSGTRHNIGFNVIDEIARKAGGPVFIQKWEAMTAKVSMWGATVHLVKPMTYMNLSGKAVAKFIDFFKVPNSKLMVIHDDLDMNPGRLKLVYGGGSGGHNGIRSIVQTIGSQDFYRLKIGIGRPGTGVTPAQMPVERYVLTSFHQDEAQHIAGRMSEILTGLQHFFEGDPGKAMSFLNSFK